MVFLDTPKLSLLDFARGIEYGGASVFSNLLGQAFASLPKSSTRTYAKLRAGVRGNLTVLGPFLW
jgi:hypothetical protein